MCPLSVRRGLLITLILVAALVASFWLLQRRSKTPPSSAALKEVSPPAGPGSLADQQIRVAEAKLRKHPENPHFYAELATAYMHKARESGDAAYYARAEAACTKALQLAPNNYAVIRLISWVYSGQHRFREALDAAKRALALDRQDPWNYGTLGDALVELGQYPEAADAIQKMVDLRPDVSSYTRAAYVRELFGDTEGAIQIMDMAVRAASPRDLEHSAWCRVQLGNLFFNTGRLAEAESQYVTALKIFPDYHYGLTGMGRVRAAQKKFQEAIQFYKRSLEIVPMQDTAVALGDLLLYLGRVEEAAKQFALLDIIEKINRANNMRPESQMALFYADHDQRLGEALQIAQQQARDRQDIRTLDTLAWVLYKSGRYQEALAASKKALRLGTKDALLYYHAGMIQAKLGHKNEAVAALNRALEINPYFHTRHAQEARAILDPLLAAQEAGNRQLQLRN
jgi:tetratricopeptide (TPR) repeat protein